MHAIRAAAAAALLALTACAGVAPPPPAPTPQSIPAPAPVRSSAEVAARTFLSVVERVEPVAEAECRRLDRTLSCDYLIAVDDRPGLPPNAFQTLTPEGRPVVGFTLSLILEARNADELAFILGHEAAHHIAGHLARVQDSARAGAVIAGTLASLGGADAATVERALQLGAEVGARSFSKEFELEADALGARIAALAGYDPLRGAAFFTRIPDPGNEFLGTHPPNAERLATVRAAAAGL